MAERRPTIADVAAHAGVSLGAVSFALNGRPGVGEETRKRILAVARELGWQPSHRARSLSTSRAFALGLVLARSPELFGADPFFPSFIGGVETVLSPRGQSLVLQVVPDLEAETEGYRRLAGESTGRRRVPVRPAARRHAPRAAGGGRAARRHPQPARRRPRPSPPSASTTGPGSPRRPTTFSSSATPGSRTSPVRRSSCTAPAAVRRWPRRSPRPDWRPDRSSSPTSPPPGARRPPGSCSTWPTRRPRSSTPTT